MVLIVVRVLLWVACRYVYREVVHGLRVDMELLVDVVLLEDAVRAEWQRITVALENVDEDEHVEGYLIEVL